MSQLPASAIVQRVLSPAQALARARLIDAAIELAAAGGYDAVGMRDVAKAAGMSTAKAYQHAGSKDQLLFDALMALGERSTAAVQAKRPAGGTPASRIEAVLNPVLTQIAQRPLLYRALYRAYIASSPAIGEIEGLVAFGPERAAWIGEALRAGDRGGYSDEDLAEVAYVLSTMFLGAMVGLAAGRQVDDVIAVLAAGVRRLLPER